MQKWDWILDVWDTWGYCEKNQMTPRLAVVVSQALVGEFLDGRYESDF